MGRGPVRSVAVVGLAAFLAGMVLMMVLLDAREASLSEQNAVGGAGFGWKTGQR